MKTIKMQYKPKQSIKLVKVGRTYAIILNNETINSGLSLDEANEIYNNLTN